MIRKILTSSRFVSILWVVFSTCSMALGQQEGLQREREFVSQSGDQMWYSMGLLAAAGLGFAIYLWHRSKKGKNKVEYNYKNRYENYYTSNAKTYDLNDK